MDGAQPQRLEVHLERRLARQAASKWPTLRGADGSGERAVCGGRQHRVVLVSGCAKCTASGERYSYSVCEEHDVCIRCSTHRSALAETPWGNPDGFICKPYRDREDSPDKAEALAKVAKHDYHQSDYRAQDECKCPHCATVIHIESEDYGDKNMYCDTCGGRFELTTECSVTFTTRVVGERIIA